MSALEEAAREQVVTVAPDAGVDEIARTMFDESVGSVLVVDQGHLRGIVTDRDLAIELLSGEGAVDAASDPDALGEVTAHDVMTADPVTVEAGTELPAALREMEDAMARRVPIVDDGEVVGIVTMDDVLERVAGESTEVAAKLEAMATVVRAESPE